MFANFVTQYAISDICPFSLDAKISNLSTADKPTFTQIKVYFNF
jgi:hypothetical protein